MVRSLVRSFARSDMVDVDLEVVLSGKKTPLAANPESAMQLDMPISQSLRVRLADLRKALLTLHKVLLDGEKIQYEKLHGQIQGVNHYLNLVMNDPHFEWLHRISELIVQIDETQDDKECGSRAAVDMIERAQRLFAAREPQDESDFMRHYKACLMHNPGAVLAHAELRRSLLSDA